jgi:hypothetical protein
MASAGGCMSQAKVVTTNKLEGTGTVSIPSNTNDFPYYYRRDAMDLIDKQVNGQKYTITYDGPAKPAAPAPGSAAAPSAADWWISYRVQGAPPAAVTAPRTGERFIPLNPVSPAGGPVPSTGVTSAGGTMPQQAPLPAGTVPNPYPAGVSR